jgi:hypothetical protein
MAERRDRIRVQVAGKEFHVVGGNFQEMLAAVKQINGRRFVGELKVWQLPGTVQNIQNQLEVSGYSLEGGASLNENPGPAPAISSAPSGSGTDRIRVLNQGRSLTLVGGSFQEMLAVVKNLPGRRFDSQSKLWEVPGELAIIKKLVEAAGFRLEGAEQGAAVSAIMEPVPDVRSAEPPAYEEPDFFDNTAAPAYEPPDWWDDDNMPPPPMEPPDWLAEREASAPPEPGYDWQAEPADLRDEPVSPSATPAGRGHDQIRVRLGGIPLLISGGSFQEMLALVKTLPGRRFDGEDKVWDIPADMTLEAFQRRVQAAGFVVKRG